MKTNYLFPYRFKTISGVIFSITLICLSIYFCSDSVREICTITGPTIGLIGTGSLGLNTTVGYNTDTITDEILFLIFIISGLIFAFSKEKIEDERVEKIRLDSLVWATYFNYITILFLYLFVHGIAFINVMMVALFSHLIFFIIRFRWSMYQQNKIEEDEE